MHVGEAGKSPRYRSHLGCIIPRVPAITCGQGSENHSQLFRAVAIAGSDSFYLENAQGSAGLVLEAKDGGGHGARLQM